MDPALEANMAAHHFIDQILATKAQGLDTGVVISRALWSGLDLDTIEGLLQVIEVEG
jgi:hypothetical protein